MIHKTPELLAPAGDWDALKAAVANGADAVYFGLSNFNARHRATNFSPDDLPAVVAYLHSHNVKGYLAFNTLIFSDELEGAAEYVKMIAAAGVDAVIVQDLGLARLIRAMAPTLPLHASTQMTLTEPGGMEFVRALGIERVILARELSLEEIRKITAATTMGVEVFVHGALCVAYSGQCLTSESLGGRSANRGQCAQACRLRYALVVDGAVRDLGDKAYLLSPQDLAAHDLIGDLTAAGAAAFKIEGRLKSAHYVAATTQTYRAAIDAAIRGNALAISPQQKLDLEQSFSRGFTHGFLGGVNHQELVTARFPKARGTRVGTVEKVGTRGIVVVLEEARGGGMAPARGGAGLKLGDGVVFDQGHPEQDEQGGRVFAVRAAGEPPKGGTTNAPRHAEVPGLGGTTNTPPKGGTTSAGRIEIELGYGDVNLAAIAPGAIVWKTDDPAVRKRLEHSFARDTVVHREKLTMRLVAHVGESIELTVTDGHGRTATAAGKVLEKANKFPATAESVREQLGRLGDTPYELGEVTFDEAGGPMVPKSVLNELRRQAVEQVMRQRGVAHAVVKAGALGELRAAAERCHAQWGRGPAGHAEHSATSDMLSGAPAPLSMAPNAALSVLVRTQAQLDAVLGHAWPAEALQPEMVYCDFEDVRLYGAAVAAARKADTKIALATLRIVKPQEHGTLKAIADHAPDAVLVRNLAAVAYYRAHCPKLPMIGDYSLNVANELAAAVFAEAGLVRMVPAYDLAFGQLAALLRRCDPGLFEIVLHQHMPMFHMEHCVFAHTLSTGKDYRDCGRPCDRHVVDLQDRIGERHPLIPDVGCRNTLFNAVAQSAAEYLPEFVRMGVRQYRVELLRQEPAEAVALVEKYGRLLTGKESAAGVLHSLRVLNHLGVTPGTLARE